MLGTMLTGCGKVNELPADQIKKGNADASSALHDPQVIQAEDGTYYMFGSHMTAATSTDLIDWDSYADGVNKWNKLFDNLFDEEFTAFKFVGKSEEGGRSVWAPSVIYNEKMQKYVMYFCTTSTFIKSNLCFATADNIEGPYTYQDTILYSGFTKSTVGETNFLEVMGEDVKISNYVKNGSFQNLQWPNCIDPAPFYDADGKMWMVYGSWSGGMFLLELDEETGYPIYPEADEANHVDHYYGKWLAGGGHNSVEGPYIEYDAESGYYYLFVSYGGLTSDGGYQIRQFRSEAVDGPYVDAEGHELENGVDHSQFGVKMMGNYTLPSLDVSYKAPGGQSTFVSDGKKYLVYHQRFKDATENHQPRVHQMFSTENGWLVAAPFATKGESLSETGYSNKDLQGTFYLLNHGLDIGSKVRDAKETTFDGKGKISGEYQGSYEVSKNSNYVTLTVDDVTYHGVIIEMIDEGGNDTLCFSAVGENNETIWGVHYLETPLAKTK